MPLKFKCPKNQKKTCRVRKISGGQQKLCGCAKGKRFTKIKEIKTIKRGKSTYSYPK